MTEWIRKAINARKADLAMEAAQREEAERKREVLTRDVPGLFCELADALESAVSFYTQESNDSSVTCTRTSDSIKIERVSDPYDRSFLRLKLLEDGIEAGNSYRSRGATISNDRMFLSIFVKDGRAKLDFPVQTVVEEFLRPILFSR